MNDDQFQDLKQFITTTVSQATADMATKQDIAELRKEVQEGFDGIGEAISTINDRVEDHETRITDLESSKA